MRKQFNLQDWLKDKSQKVKTRCGFPARIICYDRAVQEGQPTELKLCVLVREYGGETVYYYYSDGTKWAMDEDYDLFFVTQESELTEFEKTFYNLAESYHSDKNPDEVACCKEYAAELLTIARKQLQPEIDAMLEDAYKTADEVQYRKGREEALKDLPRWKPSNCPRSNLPSLYLTGDGTALYKDGYEISISSLEKLPKEETNL